MRLLTTAPRPFRVQTVSPISIATKIGTARRCLQGGRADTKKPRRCDESTGDLPPNYVSTSRVRMPYNASWPRDPHCYAPYPNFRTGNIPEGQVSESPKSGLNLVVPAEISADFTVVLPTQMWQVRVVETLNPCFTNSTRSIQIVSIV